jgi:hypothetical protein
LSRVGDNPHRAEWCDALTRQHGIEGRFHAGFWSSPVRTPDYYPDAVTLHRKVTVAQVLSDIDVSEGCSVKDSFACLDLGAAGFRPLFGAEWVAKHPGDRRPTCPRDWSALSTEDELRRWQASWVVAPGGSSFFRPALLKDATIAVLACLDGDLVVAGAIAIRSATVVGVSNVFDGTGDLDSAWAAAATAAATLWGGLPIVGYGSGDDLAAAHSAEFKSIGELVVWSNDAL